MANIGKYMQSQQYEGEHRVVDRKGLALGFIEFYPPWRCFVFQPCIDSEFNAQCLRDLAEYLDAEDAKRTSAMAPTGEG